MLFITLITTPRLLVLQTLKLLYANIKKKPKRCSASFFEIN